MKKKRKRENRAWRKDNNSYTYVHKKWRKKEEVCWKRGSFTCLLFRGFWNSVCLLTTWIPSTHDNPSVVGISLNLVYYVSQLIHALSRVVSVHVGVLCPKVTPLETVNWSQISWWGRQINIIQGKNVILEPWCPLICSNINFKFPHRDAFYQGENA